MSIKVFIVATVLVVFSVTTQSLYQQGESSYYSKPVSRCRNCCPGYSCAISFHNKGSWSVKKDVAPGPWSCASACSPFLGKCNANCKCLLGNKIHENGDCKCDLHPRGLAFASSMCLAECTRAYQACVLNCRSLLSRTCLNATMTVAFGRRVEGSCGKHPCRRSHGLEAACRAGPHETHNTVSG